MSHEEAQADLGLSGTTSYSAQVASWLLDAEDIINRYLGTPFNADIIDYFPVTDRYELSGRNPPIDSLVIKVAGKPVPMESVFVDASAGDIAVYIDNLGEIDDRMKYPISIAYKDGVDEQGLNTAKSMAKFIVQNRYRLQEFSQRFDIHAEQSYVSYTLQPFIRGK